MVQVLLRARNLQGDPGRVRQGEDAQLGMGHTCVREERPLFALRDFQDVFRRRQRRGLILRSKRLAVRIDGLNVTCEATDAGTADIEIGTSGGGVDVAMKWSAGDRLRAGAQSIVEVAA